MLFGVSGGGGGGGGSTSGWRAGIAVVRASPTHQALGAGRGVSSATKSEDQFYLFNTAFVLEACI